MLGIGSMWRRSFNYDRAIKLLHHCKYC